MIYLSVLLIIPFSMFLPWWGFVPPCFFAGFFAKNAFYGFLAGFMSLAIVWLGVSYLQNAQSYGLMAQKMSIVLPFGGSSWLLIGFTAIFGGLLGGLWSWLGFLFYQKFWKVS